MLTCKRNKGFIAHIDKLRSYLDAPEEIHLGRKPEDLLETLVNMVLGSPAICIYRSNGRSTARATSLACHSMGGHGALVLGLRNPARFTAISAFAPILNPMQVPWGVKAFTTYLGADTNAWKSWDATELIKETTSLPILITQGSKDGFYEKQLKETTFLKNAEEARNNIQYQMKEGYDHSYFFISTFLEEHFAFHLSHL